MRATQGLRGSNWVCHSCGFVGCPVVQERGVMPRLVCPACRHVTFVEKKIVRAYEL